MYKKRNRNKTQLYNNPTTAGESIEETLRRLTANKEPIPENVPRIYTDKKDGVIADYDIRADRFDVAMQARDKYAASEIAKGAQGAPDAGESEEQPKNEEQ